MYSKVVQCGYSTNSLQKIIYIIIMFIIKMWQTYCYWQLRQVNVVFIYSQKHFPYSSVSVYSEIDFSVCWKWEKHVQVFHHHLLTTLHYMPTFSTLQHCPTKCYVQILHYKALYTENLYPEFYFCPFHNAEWIKL